MSCRGTATSNTDNLLDGLVVSAIGMGIVFVALALLGVVIYALSRIDSYLEKRAATEQEAEEADTSSAEQPPQFSLEGPATPDVVAAIAVALALADAEATPATAAAPAPGAAWLQTGRVRQLNAGPPGGSGRRSQ